MMKRLNTALFTMAMLTAPIVTAQSIKNLEFGPRQEQQGNRIDGIAAIVGDDIITVSEMQAVGNSREKFERLVMQKLLIQAAQSRNISIGDTALNIALDDLRRKGQSTSREKLRELLMIEKLKQQVANSLVDISELEVNNWVEKRLKQSDSKLKLIDILLPLPQSADAETLAKAQEKTQRVIDALKTSDPKTVARKNRLIFNDLGWVPVSKIPTKFAQALINAPTNEFLAPITDSDGIHLLKILARQSDKKLATTSTVPETRVSHILIKQETANAQRIINDVYQQLKSGADFAELAKKYSQDDGSASQGGALGWAYPGQMVADFEVVMNRTGLGKVSKPFASPFGYHILTVHERRKANRNNRDALAQQARQAIFSQRAAEEWEAWLVQLRDEANVEILK